MIVVAILTMRIMIGISTAIIMISLKLEEEITTGRKRG